MITTELLRKLDKILRLPILEHYSLAEKELGISSGNSGKTLYNIGHLAQKPHLMSLMHVYNLDHYLCFFLFLLLVELLNLSCLYIASICSCLLWPWLHLTLSCWKVTLLSSSGKRTRVETVYCSNPFDSCHGTGTYQIFRLSPSLARYTRQ